MEDIRKVKIKHNPYTLETKFEVEGKEISRGNKLEKIIFSFDIPISPSLNIYFVTIFDFFLS